jgi:hypothetical protein
MYLFIKQIINVSKINELNKKLDMVPQFLDN